MSTDFRGIGVENFRVFKDSQYFSFMPITILTGTNSSGKSSLIKSIQFLQNISNSVWNERLMILFDKFYWRNESDIVEESLSSKAGKGFLDYHSEFFSVIAKIKSIDFLDHIEALGTSDEIFNHNSQSDSFSLNFWSNFGYQHNQERFSGQKRGLDMNVFFEFEKSKDKTSKIVFKDIKLKNDEGNTVVQINREEGNILDLGFFLQMFKELTYWETEDLLGLHFKDIKSLPLIKELEMFFNSEKELIQFDFNQKFIDFHIDESKLRIDEEYTKKVTELLSYLRHMKLLDNLKLSTNDNTITEVNKHVNEFIIPDIEKKINENRNNLMFSYFFYLTKLKGIDDFILPFCSFSANNNGQAIKNIFNHFIYNVLFNGIAEGLFPFKRIKSLSTNRNVFMKELQIKPLQNTKSKIELYFNTYMRHSEVKQKVIKEFIRTALSEKYLDLAEDFDVQINPTSGCFIVKNNSRWQNISEVGTGVQNIIAVVFILAFSNDYANSYRSEEAGEDSYGINLFDGENLIIIEEPEMNLHPKAQSRLADLFVYANSKFRCNILIETHSEYLIRKLQFLTADSKIQTWQTQIYYFHHPDKVPEGERQIYPINILEDGGLTKKFGSGFFDVSSNLNIALYNF